MATAGAAAEVASSAGPIRRPTAGVTPRTGKKLLTTYSPSTISGSRPSAGTHGEVGGRRADQGGQDVVIVAEVLVALPGEAVEVGLARVLVEEFHQLLGIAHGQRTQHQGVDEAENGGIGADFEPERGQCDGGESGRAPHHAQGVANVLGEGGERGWCGMCAPWLGWPVEVIVLVN
jgi:hypothetical protein